MHRYLHGCPHECLYACLVPCMDACMSTCRNLGSAFSVSTTNCQTKFQKFENQISFFLFYHLLLKTYTMCCYIRSCCVAARFDFRNDSNLQYCHAAWRAQNNAVKIPSPSRISCCFVLLRSDFQKSSRTKCQTKFAVKSK